MDVTPGDVTALISGISDDHRITPAVGSARRTDGRPADLRNPVHYPVTAVCAECGREIWCKAAMFAEWQHVTTGDSTTGGRR
jgi:hypothetical protein